MDANPDTRTVVAGAALVVSARQVQQVKLLLESLSWLCTSHGHKIVPYTPSATLGEKVFQGTGSEATQEVKTPFRLLPLTASATAVILYRFGDCPNQHGGAAAASAQAQPPPEPEGNAAEEEAAGEDAPKTAAIAELGRLLSTNVARFVPSEQLPPPPLPRRERPGVKGSKNKKAPKRKRDASGGGGVVRQDFKRGAGATPGANAGGTVAASGARQHEADNSAAAATIETPPQRQTHPQASSPASAPAPAPAGAKAAFTFVELFAGVGGVGVNMQQCPGECARGHGRRSAGSLAIQSNRAPAAIRQWSSHPASCLRGYQFMLTCALSLLMMSSPFHPFFTVSYWNGECRR